MSADKSVRAVARVRIIVEVGLTQPWPADATLAQVHEQAKRDAEQSVRILLQGQSEVRLLSAVEVDAVIVTRNERGEP